MSNKNGVHAGTNGPRMVFGKENLDYQPSAASPNPSGATGATRDAAASDWNSTKSTLVDSLDDYLELDSTSITIDENGVATDTGEYPPEQGSYGHIDDYMDGLKREGWAPVEGITGQHGYNGPINHPSESLSGSGAARKIVSTPGTYAVVSVCSADEGDEGYEEMEPDGWMLLKKDEPLQP